MFRDAQLLVSELVTNGVRHSGVPGTVSDDAKSALWLYAWSFVDWRAQRREAYAHITQIAEATETLVPAT